MEDSTHWSRLPITRSTRRRRHCRYSSCSTEQGTKIRDRFPTDELSPSARNEGAPLRGAEAETDPSAIEAQLPSNEPGDTSEPINEDNDDFLRDIDSTDDLKTSDDNATTHIEQAAETEPTDEQPRRSARIAGCRVDTFILWAYRLSLSLALKKRSKGIKEAIQKELKQMIESLDISRYQSVNFRTAQKSNTFTYVPKR